MADIERSIKLGIDTGDSLATLGKLKKELANLYVDLEGAERGSAAFKKLDAQIKSTEQSVKKAEAAFGDAADKIKTLSGSGVERATASFGLLKEGITSLDFGKFKTGLTGITSSFRSLGGAIAATGIGAIVIGVTLLIQNFDKLAASGGIVGEVFTFIGDTITNIIEDITALSDAIGLTDTKAAAAQEAADERNKKALEERLNLVDKVKSSYEKQIEVAKAAGKDTTDLEKKSAEAQKQVLKTNIAYLENIAKQSTFFADLIEPVLNKQKEKLIEIEQAEKVSNANRTKDAIDAEKEKNKKREEINDQYALTELQRIEKQKQAKIKEAQDAGASPEAIAGIEQEYWEKTLKERQRLSGDTDDMIKSKTITSIGQTLTQVGLTIKETPIPPVEIQVLTPTEQVQAFFETYKEQISASFEIGNQFVGALSSLNDLVTTNKTKNLEKGSKAEEAVLKKSFERNKKLAIAGAVISGIQGVVNALTAKSTIPEPFGTALKVVNSVAVAASTAANIAKIKSTKFESTSATPPDTGNLGGGGGGEGGPSIAPPVFNLGGQQIGGASNMLGNQNNAGGQQPIKVFVSETDISNVSNKVKVTEGNSLFGSGG